MQRHAVLALSLLALLAACTAPAHVPLRTSIIPNEQLVAATVTTQSLVRPTDCAGNFIPHQLPYQTATSTLIPHLFESNGAGLAVGDLDGDGLPELVFANLSGPSAILWNLGGLQFSRQDLEAQNTRAVALVDQDGDGRLDLAFTQRGAGVSLWRNQGDHQFVLSSLAGVRAAAYAMAWADLSGSGQLDLITGSYDAERTKDNPNGMFDTSNNGVFVYRQNQNGYRATRLANEAQTLAIAAIDLNGDGRRDLTIGNDFAMPDATWLQHNETWQKADLFLRTSHSTMSFDWGDIDNNGQLALFATDMKPDTIDVGTLAAWLPMMQKMPESHPPGDRQTMANVLQLRGPDGRWREEATARGIDATGWSWAGLFGDLDNDGLLDLYVVNGMAAPELFAHLPNSALIEPNRAFRNVGGRFLPLPAWGLGATEGGRGMVMADLDRDGDLDIAVNNLGAPATLFENRICGGAGLEVNLQWHATHNYNAIGSQIRLVTSAGTMTRDVRTTSGYLSGSDPQIHFGLPTNAVLERLEITWPDGKITMVQPLAPQTHMLVAR